MAIYRRPKEGMAAGDAIPFRHKDQFHLFHLSSPVGTSKFPERVKTTWSHATSRDLVGWEELAAALPPGEGTAPDANGSWTGSVIEANGEFHLFYTGHKLGSTTPQTICRAKSMDCLTFTKDDANPLILPDTSHFESIDWRDPFVFWNEDEGQYWMLIAARLTHGSRWRRGCIALATSPDLDRWTLQTEPFYAPGNTFCPECPEMFKLGGRWYLVYSRFSEDAATLYRVSHSSRGPWKVLARETLDGRRWYASKSMPIDSDSRAFFGWIHDRDGATDEGNWLWGGDFTAPREIRAASDGTLTVRLPIGVERSYSQKVPIQHVGGIETQAGGELVLDANEGFAHSLLAVNADDFLFHCTLEPLGAPSKFGLIVRADSELSGLAIVFDRIRSSVSLQKWPAPLDTFWADLVGRGKELREVDGPRLWEAFLDPSELTRKATLKLLVSGSVIEVYINDSLAVSYRMYAKGDFGPFVEDGTLRCAGMMASIRPD